MYFFRIKERDSLCVESVIEKQDERMRGDSLPSLRPSFLMVDSFDFLVSVGEVNQSRGMI